MINRQSYRLTVPQRRFVIGGVGGLMPTVLSLYLGTVSDIIENFQLGTLLGFLFRPLLAFILGGLWAWVHTDERKRLKLLELGMLAPTVLVAIMNGTAAQAQRSSSPDPIPPVSERVRHAPLQAQASMMLVSLTRAQSAEGTQVKQFSPPEQSGPEQFRRGLTGQRSNRIWFVIVSSHYTLAAAQAAAGALDERALTGLEFHADVYEPSGEYPYFAVVIGANLDGKEADSLRQRALAAGFPLTTNVWRPSL